MGFDDLPGRHKELSGTGVTGLCLYGWSLGGFDTRYPEFYPDLDLGGPDALRLTIQTVHDQGGSVMTYLNGRIVNLDSPYLQTLGRSWAVRAPDGSLVTETYGTQEFAVMCPGAPGWRQLLVDLGRTLVTQFGTDLVYCDQVSSARPIACYSPDHDHLDPGMWNRHYLSMLGGAFLACNRGNAAAALYVEGCGDLYAPLAPFQEDLTLFNGGTRFGFPELFRFTFPEVRIVDVVHNVIDPPEAVFRLPEAVTAETALWHLHRGILHGHYLTPLPSITSDSPWFSQVAGLLRLASGAGPWLNAADFRDDREVRACPERVQAKTHQGEGFVVEGILAPNPCVSGEVTIDVGDLKITEAQTLTVSGRSDIAVAQFGKTVTISVPDDALSFTVLQEVA